MIVLSILTIVFAIKAFTTKTDAQNITNTPVQSPILTHQQEVWMYALEWCESRGVQTSINPKDRDGTPSYYSWQFKPGTFKYLGIKYAVIPKETTDAQAFELMKDYKLQQQIVQNMILDKDTKWNNEFPDCVKRKVGLPPVKK